MFTHLKGYYRENLVVIVNTRKSQVMVLTSIIKIRLVNL